MGTEALEKSVHVLARKKQMRLRAMALVALCLAAFIYILVDHLPKLGSTSNAHVDPLASLEHLKNCTITFGPTKGGTEWSTKPLWFPAHPGTIIGEDSFHKQLITGITGLDAGGKSFYASSKAQKQCFGQTETATCLNVHPIVDMEAKHPETRSEKFFDKFVLGLRNPMYTLPAFYNGKAIKYHGLCAGCQVTEEDWRKFRDEWLEGMLDAWVNMIDTWKKMTKYQVGAYFVMEHLWDPAQGPLLLQRLANLLKEAGFSTPAEEEIPCIWLKIMGGEKAIKAHHESPYEYKDYIPAYTVAQRSMMIEKLDELTTKYANNDTELVEVLKQYQEEIRNTARIETNETKAARK